MYRLNNMSQTSTKSIKEMFYMLQKNLEVLVGKSAYYFFTRHVKVTKKHNKTQKNLLDFENYTCNLKTY